VWCVAIRAVWNQHFVAAGWKERGIANSETIGRRHRNFARNLVGGTTVRFIWSYDDMVHCIGEGVFDWNEERKEKTKLSFAGISEYRRFLNAWN